MVWYAPWEHCSLSPLCVLHVAEVQTADCCRSTQILVHSFNFDQGTKYYQAVLRPSEYESKQLQTYRKTVLLCTRNFDNCWQRRNKWTMRCVRRMTNVSTRFTLLECLILTVGLTLGLGSNQHVGFTFLLPAGSTECFFQTTARDDNMEIEYQVNALFSLTFIHSFHLVSVDTESVSCFE